MTRAFFTIRNNRDFNSEVLICYLYKLAEGYPSNIQDVVERAYSKFKRSKVFTKEPEYVSTESLISALLWDNCMMWRANSAKSTVDFYDYEYIFTNNTVKVKLYGKPTFSGKPIFSGTLTEFMEHDFSGEWVEGMPTRED